ncbi:MAG: SAM-dependent DNA methyltransferase [Verrucomicrobia bacterium]|nr:SAM-dependent DNA methyltransferase [Verrucomicrobiota bacterium]MCH8528008.1 type I restriction-modification system subunit M [Kiritimatiellia bacterium]
MMNNSFSETAAFIWSVADLLRGDFKQSQYGRIILPFTLLRRLECVLEPTRTKVYAERVTHRKTPEEMREKILLRASGLSFYNASELTLSTLSSNQVLEDLDSMVQGFSREAREIFEQFKFTEFCQQLADANLLFLVVEKFASMDLSPGALDNHTMGLVFEELIRRFAESSNETAGEHFTPRDVVRLTTALVFTEDDEALTRSGTVRSLYDPTAGTGGFLSSGMEYVHELNPRARIVPFGQELNPESYAICKADMLIKGQDVRNIHLGNTLSEDKLAGQRFDYMLSNPPFGVDWKKVEKKIKEEQKVKGYAGRFGPGLPRVSDGSLLFLLHLVSKLRDPAEGGSRIGIILNGSPLFTGGAGSGESEIRRFLLEADLLECIVALPTDMFYNTGISTYIWVLNNHKPKARKGRVQLINAAEMYGKMRKSLGSKRKQLEEEHAAEIVRLYGNFEESPVSKIFDSTDFGYRRVTVERPLQLSFYPRDPARVAALLEDKAFQKATVSDRSTLVKALDAFKQDKIPSRKTFAKQLRTNGYKPGAAMMKVLQKHLAEHDEEAEICTDAKGHPEANSDLRDNENVPLKESVQDYFEREVLPHVPKAWIDESKRDGKDGLPGIVGYEIPFNRHFYHYVPPRPLEEIDRDLATVSGEIMELLTELSGV